MSLAYDGERADGRMLDQLESVLRYVADELAGWRARAVKAEAELKEGGARSGGAVAKSDPETRGRVADLEQENRTLRQRVDAARGGSGERRERQERRQPAVREAPRARGVGAGVGLEGPDEHQEARGQGDDRRRGVHGPLRSSPRVHPGSGGVRRSGT